jgi:predicted small secreted protein
MRHVSIVSVLVASLLVSACGTTPMPAGLGAKARPAGHSAARAVEVKGELALLKDVADAAKQALADLDSRYTALKLDTAAGRKLTPKNEQALREGLAPLLADLDGRITALVAKLQADGRYADLVEDLSQRRPALGDRLPADATAADMLYRAAQYRLKLGTLVEFAARVGAVSD